jgi:UDP-N-acetylglucosamine 4,6-dehydratase/5-epimerase
MRKQKVLLIGGSGSIGTGFIKEYYNDYDLINISRGENLQWDLEQEYPNVTNYTASIEDYCSLESIFEVIEPDIVIHLAAMKHIDIAENHPIHTCKVNVLGSINVIQCSKKYDVPITIGLSTDKACASESVYGTSKFLMEKCFKEANTKRNMFALCRFANVANSSSSIIPNWKKMKKEGIPLKVTDKRMNRMMFSLSDAAKFIHRTIIECETYGGGFVGVDVGMKTINIYKLAQTISDKIQIIGKRTEVEKFDEDLVSIDELPFTRELEDNYVMVYDTKQDEKYNLKDVYSTRNAETMTDKDIQRLVYGDKNNE